MPLINITNILYTLKTFRAFIVQKPTNKSNIVLLANNTIAFSLTKKDIITNKNKKIQKFKDIIFTYNNLLYVDEVYHHFNRQYPKLKALKSSYDILFPKLFKFFFNNKKLNIKLSSIILVRKKKIFILRVLGLLGVVNIYSIFNSFSNLWNNRKVINYSNFLHIMLWWLRKLIIIQVNYTFIKFFLKKKNTKITTKTNKTFIKKNTVQKASFLFSNENINLI